MGGRLGGSVLLLVELLVDLERLGDEPHQVPVPGHARHLVQHAGLAAVVAAVAVRVAVVSETSHLELEAEKDVIKIQKYHIPRLQTS